MPTGSCVVRLLRKTGSDRRTLKTRMTSNGVWASVSEQRVVKRLGFVLAD
jgi:hypothetical protein